MVLNDYGINWLFLPASFGAGDLFGFFRLREDILAFYIFDVMGHGIGATITSILIHDLIDPEGKNTIITAQDSKIYSPTEVLQKLNTYIADRNPFQFVSIIYGLIDAGSGKVTCARGGHHYPCLLKKTGEILEIKPEGPALGLQKDADFRVAEFEMQKGERLCLFSDGLVECMNSDEKQFSRERLIEFLANNTDEGLNNLSELLFEWRGLNYFDDDISLVVIERKK